MLELVPFFAQQGAQADRFSAAAPNRRLSLGVMRRRFLLIVIRIGI